MSQLPNLEELDQDGAIREAAEQVDGDTRSAFLRKAGVGGVAVLGSSAFFGALPTIASAGVAKSDVAILNFALTLEYLESAFYTEATKHLSGSLDKQTEAFLKTVTFDEKAHVAFLQKGLGRHAVKKPKFNFRGTTSDAAKFKATAYVLENTGVHAYLGQAGNLLKTPQFLVAAASIVTVEARHAGSIATILGKPIAPNGPFDNGQPASEILAAVKGTGFIV